MVYPGIFSWKKIKWLYIFSVFSVLFKVLKIIIAFLVQILKKNWEVLCNIKHQDVITLKYVLVLGKIFELHFWLKFSLEYCCQNNFNVSCGWQLKVYMTFILLNLFKRRKYEIWKSLCSITRYNSVVILSDFIDRDEKYWVEWASLMPYLTKVCVSGLYYILH